MSRSKVIGEFGGMHKMSGASAAGTAMLDLAHSVRASRRQILEGASGGRNILQVWRGRIRFRRQLWRLLRDSPTLIEDIGLTVAQAKEEVALPFWRHPCVSRA